MKGKIIMTETPRFEGAKTAYMSSCSYIKVLIDELGMEKALEIMTKSDDPRGIRVGKSIKEEAGGKVFNVNDTLNTILNMASEIGATDDILEETKQRAVTVTKFGNCPIYEAAKAIGMTDEVIEPMCRASSLVFLDNVVKQLNPKLSYKVTAFRSTEHGGCVEEIVLEE